MESWKIELYAPYLAHHGIEGQKWGVKHGPPYPLQYKSLSKEEKKHVSAGNRIGDSYGKRSMNKLNRQYKSIMERLDRKERRLKDDGDDEGAREVRNLMDKYEKEYKRRGNNINKLSLEELKDKAFQNFANKVSFYNPLTLPFAAIDYMLNKEKYNAADLGKLNLSSKDFDRLEDVTYQGEKWVRDRVYSRDNSPSEIYDKRKGGK